MTTEGPGGEGPDPAADPAARPAGGLTGGLRLASFNLFSGRSPTDGGVDGDRLRAALAGLDAEVLALQEVDAGQPRSAGLDQTALAADVLGATDHRFVATVRGTPGEPGWRPVLTASDGAGSDGAGGDGAGGDGAGPRYGVALLSRRPVTSWHVLRLAGARGRYPMPLPGPPDRRVPGVLWLRDEPRAVVAAVLAEPRITVACTHLSFVPGVNVAQLLRVRRWLESLPAPRILLGDLNLPGRLPGRLTGWTVADTGPTFPAAAPRVQLDHVLHSGLPAGATLTGESLALAVSDHRAVLAELRLP